MSGSITRFYLLRHGAVEAAWQGRLYGDLDIALSPVGEAEAAASARRLAALELAAVISSGLGRAEFTAALVRRRRDLGRRDEPDLRELKRGSWRGRTPQQVDAEEAGAWSRWLAAPQRERPAEGESLTDLSARVVPRLEALAREFAGGTVAIVAHSWVLRVATCQVLDLPLERALALDIRTGGMIAFDWPAEGARPILAGFGLDQPPERGPGWFRGPRKRTSEESEGA